MPFAGLTLISHPFERNTFFVYYSTFFLPNDEGVIHSAVSPVREEMWLIFCLLLEFFLLLLFRRIQILTIEFYNPKFCKV